MWSRRRRPQAAFALLVSVCVELAFARAPASAAELTQYFPAVPAGLPAARPESGWNITWQVREPGTHGYGGSAVWELRSVRFMKGHNADGSEDWVTVLNRLAMAEIYVPYHEGRYFLEVSGGQPGKPDRFPMVRATEDFLPKYGVVSAMLHDDGYVISEVVDDHIRWMDNQRGDRVRRGQILHVWATLNAGNYRYVLRYSFADDGTISVRAGATAESFFDLEEVRTEDHATHLHMAAWRMEFHLGNPETNKLEMVERMTDRATKRPITLKRPFNAGREGGEVWDPVKFSVLKVTSGQTRNRHEPPRNIGYALRPLRTGSVRTNFPFTKYDFWVSRLRPDNPGRSVEKVGLELRFVDVPKNVSNPEPIGGKAVVIWHQSGLNHIARTEDFGPRGYRSDDGVAITAWTGFDLVPVDLWHQTPFIERPPISGQGPPGTR